MKIAILNLTAGGMSGGYRKYLCNVLPRMAAHSEVEEILCVSPDKLNVQSWFSQIPNVDFVGCSSLGLVLPDINLQLITCLKRFCPDIIFIPVARYFRFNNIPVVNMVQNMLPLLYLSENPFHEKIRNIFLKNIAHRAVLKAQRTIAVSYYVQKYLKDKWHIPLSSLPVIYHGLAEANTQKLIRPASIPLKWKEEFLFTAGSIDPYRGLEDVLIAIQLLYRQGLKIRLVIAGEARSSMASYKRKLQSTLIQNKIADQVCWVGLLKASEMAWCYKNCKAFVTTTRVEACPNIALEAMAYGSVIISSDNMPLPEFFGDAAFYYPSRNAEYLAEEIKKVLALCIDVHSNIVEKARRRARDFSWDQTAQETIEELKKVVVS